MSIEEVSSNMKSPIHEFDDLVATSDVLFIVCKCSFEMPSHNHHTTPIPLLILTTTVYRGHWCPFCQSYLKSLQSLAPTITSSSPSNKILAITSEAASFENLTRKTTGFKEQILADEKNEIAEELRKRKVLDVAVGEKKEYEFGMVQPAVLVLGKGGKVLERWAIVPSAVSFVPPFLCCHMEEA